MNRPDITKDLFLRLENHVNPHNDPRIYTANEVTFDYSTDFLSHKMFEWLSCIEDDSKGDSKE